MSVMAENLRCQSCVFTHLGVIALVVMAHGALMGVASMVIMTLSNMQNLFQGGLHRTYMLT